ncbi:MAG: hypothetical protein MUC92_00160 [Fimbriimonadaceae bacterium]|nr:hypothetical protein [Fimbriimonadaceae bacterium]
MATTAFTPNQSSAMALTLDAGHYLALDELILSNRDFTRPYEPAACAPFCQLKEDLVDRLLLMQAQRLRVSYDVNWERKETILPELFATLVYLNRQGCETGMVLRLLTPTDHHSRLLRALALAPLGYPEVNRIQSVQDYLLGGLAVRSAPSAQLRSTYDAMVDEQLDTLALVENMLGQAKAEGFDLAVEFKPEYDPPSMAVWREDRFGGCAHEVLVGLRGSALTIDDEMACSCSSSRVLATLEARLNSPLFPPVQAREVLSSLKSGLAREMVAAFGQIQAA